MEKTVREIYADIDGARIEGRLENVLSRKKQLLRLYNKLQSSTDDIVAALKRGTAKRLNRMTFH
jgi:hypothetical protein